MTSRAKLTLSKTTSSGRLNHQSAKSASFNGKVEALISTPRLNRSFDLFRLLTESAKSLKLQIPETLLIQEGEEWFLSTLQSGVIRADKEQG